MGKLSRRKIIIALTLLVVFFIVFRPKVHYPPTQAAPQWTPTIYENLKDWPIINRPPLDPAIERNIDKLLVQMTLQEKVGQMTQAEIKYVTPEQVETYHLGSVLNGGGAWPNDSPRHDIDDWLTLADEFWLASQNTRLKIPIMWGTDAIHGHNNFTGATLFPHNIGLGASTNPELIKAISEATAKQVIATGLDWTFAPTLAAAQNPRWGRTYESFSQSGQWIYPMAKAAVEGLQGDDLTTGILATAKHFIGDGGLSNGKDQGRAMVSEKKLINLHGQGYFAALESNVQIVMAYYSSWWFTKMNSHEYLLTDILKNKMGFDGFVITDYNAIEQIHYCTTYSCPQAINAGIDMVMVPRDWRSFIKNTVEQVEQGVIPTERIDDAVRRILRVKYRAGLFDKPMPSDRPGAGDSTLLNSPELQLLARQAVQESLVMLKNNHQILPLKKNGKYLMVGDYDRINRQAGGWSISWQGKGWDNEYFPHATSIIGGIKEVITPHRGSLIEGNFRTPTLPKVDAAIVVLTERTYAEFSGDIPARFSTAAERQLDFHGVKLLELLHQEQPDIPVVTVYIGGRPLWMNPQLNQSDAFIVAWLPGTEGIGVADGLFGDAVIDGRLPINWPMDDCSGAPAKMNQALFPVGYGITFDDTINIDNDLPDRAAKTWGTLGLAPRCIWNNVFRTPFR